jgi:hypothetical protein
MDALRRARLLLLCSTIGAGAADHSSVAAWWDDYSWARLGRAVCQCSDRCEELRRTGLSCLPARGGHLLVKTYGGEVEIHARYNPLPSRGLAFIRVFEGAERQTWRRARRTGELAVQLSGPAGGPALRLRPGGLLLEGRGGALPARAVLVQDQRRPWLHTGTIRLEGKPGCIAAE